MVDVPEKEFPGDTAGECSKVSVFSTGACDAFEKIKWAALKKRVGYKKEYETARMIVLFHIPCFMYVCS